MPGNKRQKLFGLRVGSFPAFGFFQIGDKPGQMTPSLELPLAVKSLFLVHPCVKLLPKEDFQMSSVL